MDNRQLLAGLNARIVACRRCPRLVAQREGVKGLARRARDLGATDAEIMETIRIAFWVGGASALNTGLAAFEA